MSKLGYVKVELDYAPPKNGKAFDLWCQKNGFNVLGSGRRAWCSEYRTYFRDALGVAHTESGESFLFYADDLVSGLVKQDLSQTEASQSRPEEHIEKEMG